MSYKALFSPVQIGDSIVKNRLFMAPLTRNRAKDSYPTDLMREYYVQRVSAGIIISEAIMISPQGAEWTAAPGIWDAKHVAGWKNIIDGVHEAGGTIYAQLWHGGRALHPDLPQQKLSGLPVYAPSAIKARGGKFRTLLGNPGYVIPTALEDPQIIIEQFKHAAMNAKEAGFDGIEIHCGGGYMIHSFLDYTSNHRTDKWGGNIENRSRFGLEVIKVLIEIFGHNVAVKITPCGGMNDIGMPLQDTIDTFTYFITEVDKLKLAYILLLRYRPVFDPVFDGVSRATKHDVLESYGSLIKNSKLVVTGGVTAEEGEMLVSSGKVDAVAIGMNWISNPDLAKRIENGKPLDNVVNIARLYTEERFTDWSIGYTDYPKATY